MKAANPATALPFTLNAGEHYERHCERRLAGPRNDRVHYIGPQYGCAVEFVEAEVGDRLEAVAVST